MGDPDHTQKPVQESKLTVKVKPPGAAIDPAKDHENPWIVTPMIRSLPAALWAQYSKDNDPTKSGNNISAVLNPPSGGGADPTIPHIAAYSFLSPDPRLPSPEHNLPTFNAIAAMREGIFQDGQPKTRNDAHPLLDPKVNPADKDERPIMIPSAPIQTACLAVERDPKSDDETRLANLNQLWTNTDPRVPRLLADVWTDMFGWVGTQDVDPVAAGKVGMRAKMPINLNNAKPVGLLSDIDIAFLDVPFLGKDVAVQT
jgi:hypothetical protein